ncbi:MAG: hypothetical protein MZV65_13090 [Chromatiales bacterium]|nr:hypothetical protein [Chromatiales bacterium]
MLLIACASGAQGRRQADDTTGHVWDERPARAATTRCRAGGCGCSYITVVFSVVYLVLYPGLGSVSTAR